MTIKYLTSEQMLEINESVLTNGEQSGFLYQGGVEFTIDEIKNVDEEHSEQDAIIGKAAYLWHTIASNQYFIHGNKRTAFRAAFVFLDINGVELEASDDDTQFISKAIAQKHFEIEDVFKWLTQNL